MLFQGCLVGVQLRTFLKGRVGYCRSSAMQNLISTPVHNHVPVMYILGPEITTTTGKCDP